MTETDIYLREITRIDLPTIIRWVSNKTITDGFGDSHKFVTPESTEKWFQNYLARKPIDLRLAIDDRNAYDQWIYDADTREKTFRAAEPLGCIYLLNHHPINRTVDLHMFIGDKCNWRKGYGRQAVSFACQHAFLQMGVNRIQLTVLEKNKAAINLYSKCGFQVEGMMMQAVFKDGEFHNMVMMAKTRMQIVSVNSSILLG